MRNPHKGTPLILGSAERFITKAAIDRQFDCVFRRFRPPSPSEGGQCRSGATLGMCYVPEWPD